MFDFITNLIKKLFHSKKHEVFNARPHPDNPTDDHDLYLCKNCEEYIEEHALGQLYEKPHGKWKPVSNNWQKYVKTNVLWEGKKRLILKKLYIIDLMIK